jgi:3'(2'), 5'-bisphosphate nucleotidase
MDQEKLNELLEVAIEAARRGGDEILDVYDSDFAIEHKEDKSPLTLADKKADKAIKALLEPTGLPILSEEGRSIDYNERKAWDYFWMVDPLDGTKEFIKRNGEFTVNIALIHAGRSIMGVIYVPVKQTLYFSCDGLGAYKKVEENEQPLLSELLTTADKLPISSNGRKFTIVGSRSHMSEETETFINEQKEKHGEVEITSMGSSLKICLVAEGAADIYPRFAPTMEWDTAAGQAIAQGAGKVITDHTTGELMQYNKENLLNNWFIVQ